MRVTSGRVATAAMLLVGLAVLAVVGRLLPSTPSAQRPATTAATGTTSAPAIRTAPGNTRGYGVPDVLAGPWFRPSGCCALGSARCRHRGGPPGRQRRRRRPGAARLGGRAARECGGVSDQDRRAALRRAPSAAVGAGPRTAAYRIVAPDPATHQLTVAAVAPRAADIQMWLARSSSRLPVLASTRDAKWCRPSHGRIRCEVRLGIPVEGVWTASVAKRSALPAAIEVTITSTPV
jgi:hypothetical protein